MDELAHLGLKFTRKLPRVSKIPEFVMGRTKKAQVLRIMRAAAAPFLDMVYFQRVFRATLAPSNRIHISAFMVRSSPNFTADVMGHMPRVRAAWSWGGACRFFGAFFLFFFQCNFQHEREKF